MYFKLSDAFTIFDRKQAASDKQSLSASQMEEKAKKQVLEGCMSEVALKSFHQYRKEHPPKYSCTKCVLSFGANDLYLSHRCIQSESRHLLIILKRHIEEMQSLTVAPVEVNDAEGEGDKEREKREKESRYEDQLEVYREKKKKIRSLEDYKRVAGGEVIVKDDGGAEHQEEKVIDEEEEEDRIERQVNKMMKKKQ